MMDAGRGERAKRLARAALELAPPERKAFLDALSGEASSLLEEVESLVASHDPDTVPDDSPVGTEPDPHRDASRRTVTIGGLQSGDPAPIDSQQVGPYRILREVGQGGMGVVYEAEQLEPVRRCVALKLIKWGMDTRDVIARFESERQALALMSHPNIASVYDAGATPHGRPYFAMEFVPGVALTEYCDEHRLTIPQRLALFLQVCEGIQHAHQKGIIHRDIKPSNVLVSTQDDRPLLKIIDFGVAKATSQRLTEQTVYTQLGQLVGTPAYMSPEQAEMNNLDIDTRTDVYSLGVMLYELLVGEMPFDWKALRRAGFDEIRRAIREDDPPRPSTRLGSLGETSTMCAQKRGVALPDLEKRLRGDLDWITMKALARDRSRRYGSASELAMDIQAHLNDQPIRARPPSTTYAVGKFIRRNRAAVAAASLALGALAVGFSAATVGFLQASRERDAARQARDEAEEVTRFLADMLAAADPAQLGRDVTVRQVLDRASGSIQQRFHGRPLVEARLRGTIGETYDALGLYEEAGQHLRRQLDIQTELHPEQHPDRLKAAHDLAVLYREQGRLAEAEPLSVQTLELARRALGPEHPQTLVAVNSLALLYEELGRNEEAEALHLEALRVRREVLGEEHEETLATMNNLGRLYKELGRYQEAETLLTEALEIQRRVSGEDHPETLPSMGNLASLYTTTGRYEEAEPLHVAVLEICRRALGEEHRDTLVAMNNLATLHINRGRYDDAAKLLTESLEIQRRVLGDSHSSTLTSMVNLGVLRGRQDRHREAESLLVEALTLRRRALGDEHPSTLYTMSILGTLLGRMEDNARAESMFREALDIERRVLGPDHPDTLYALGGLAHALCQQAKYSEAAPAFEEFDTVAGEALPENSIILLTYRGHHGHCLARMGRFAQAEPLLLQAVSALKELLGAEHDRTREAVTHLIALYDGWGRPAEAAEYRPLVEDAGGER